MVSLEAVEAVASVLFRVTNVLSSQSCVYNFIGGWDKSPSLSIVFGLSSKTQWLSGLSTTLILSAFTALLNCAEVGRRNRILTNDRFLSHSLLVYASLQAHLVLWLEMCYNIANVSLGEKDVYH